MIPTPYFVVFYNGVEKRPEFECMRLSDSYLHKTDKPGLELVCNVYNINFRYNQDLLERSEVLRGYSFFIDQVRQKQLEGFELQQALEYAIKECISRHVLEDFFRNRKEEVMSVMTLDFTHERVQELIREESYADGKADGIAEGERNGEIKGERVGKRIVVDNMMKELGLDLPRACAVAGMTVEEYEEMKSLLKQV